MTESRKKLEQKRLEAAECFEDGMSQAKIAKKFGISGTTASRWAKAFQRDGVNGLKGRETPGRPCRLTSEEIAKVWEYFTSDPTQDNMKRGLAIRRKRTYGDVQRFIFNEFGYSYDEDYIGRFLWKLRKQHNA